MKALLAVVVFLPIILVRAQDTSEPGLVEFRVARSVALKAEPRFDSKTIRILEAGTVLRGTLLDDGAWWQATTGTISGYIRDSAIDTTGRRGRAVAAVRNHLTERLRVANRTALRDSLRALVSLRRARREAEEAAISAHERAAFDLLERGIDVSLLTARYRPDRRLTRLERAMMRLEEDEWTAHCQAREQVECESLPGPGWGFVLAFENLHDSPVDSVWFEVLAFDEDGSFISSYVFNGVGPVAGGVPGGEWVFGPGDLARTTACVELVELEVQWNDGVTRRYGGEGLRAARLPLPARGWPVLKGGPVGARYAERSRRAFGLNEVVLEGDCVPR